MASPTCGLFDLATHARSAPAGVNTNRWEWQPTISGDWILYGQQWGSRPLNGRVILHDTNTAETRVLDEQIGKPRRLLFPGQVSGDFATWDRYTPLAHTENVFLYQISTQTKTKIPVPTGKVQYSSSVTPTGTVFYARSGVGCGTHVTLHEYASGTDTCSRGCPAATTASQPSPLTRAPVSPRSTSSVTSARQGNRTSTSSPSAEPVTGFVAPPV